MTPDVSPEILDWLDVYAKSRRHFGLPADENLLFSEIDGISVGFRVGADQTVAGAGYQAPEGSPVAAMLELFCRSSVGTPIRDVVEHGVPRLLGYARTAGAIPNATGVLLPSNAGYPFDFLQSLMTQMIADEQFVSRYDEGRNEHHKAPASSWLELTHEERISSVKRVIVQHLTKAGQPEDIVRPENRGWSGRWNMNSRILWTGRCRSMSSSVRTRASCAGFDRGRGSQPVENRRDYA